MEIKIKENNSIDYGTNSTKTIKNIKTTFSEIFNEAASKSTNIDATKEVDNKSTNTDTTKEVEHTSTTADTKEETNTDIKTGNKIIDNLPAKNKTAVLKAIEKINKILGIDILGDPDQFINKDSTINMPRILAMYGNNVKYPDLDILSTSINTLMTNGLISTKDYFSALQWIATKIKIFQTKLGSEENKKSAGDLMWKPKNKKNNIFS